MADGGAPRLRLFALIRRRASSLRDIGALGATVVAAALIAFEIDVFETEGQVSRAVETLELDEVLVLTSLIVLGLLVFVWRRGVEHRRELERRRAAEAEVMSLALQDPLTGLPNRRQFDEALKAALRQPPTAPEAHALFMLDLNGFKKINDLHGHPVGDQALIHVSARLLRAVREGDLVARLGGDEFAIIARNVAGADGAAAIGRRIIDSLEPPVVIEGTRHAVGSATGVALAPQDGLDGEGLVRKADVALYRAKAERRSALRFFEPAMDARLTLRDELERALAEAVRQDDLALAFRPRVSAQGQVVAFETVAEWRRGDETLTAERFLPIAEEADLLGPLTRKLLERACKAARTWPERVRLAFELPGALLPQTSFGLTLLSVLSETGLSPARLDLEIDEGALIRDADAAMALIAPLRQAGVAVIASRFGTGYSNLQNFRRLALDGVKIDRSFVAAMGDDHGAAVMVRALIGVGQGLDLAVIADGVSSAEQRTLLEAQGCGQLQGGLYGEAVSVEEALALTAADPGRRRSA